jgi:hypothetical protein
MTEQMLTTALKHFLTPAGVFKAWPAKHKLQIWGLSLLASKFEPGRRYTEKEVNERLKSWHSFGDWCLLRRSLCDCGFLRREPNGASYWLAENQPSPADFGWKL